jgi:hypothetical protein
MILKMSETAPVNASSTAIEQVDANTFESRQHRFLLKVTLNDRLVLHEQPSVDVCARGSRRGYFWRSARL